MHGRHQARDGGSRLLKLPLYWSLSLCSNMCVNPFSESTCNYCPAAPEALLMLFAQLLWIGTQEPKLPMLKFCDSLNRLSGKETAAYRFHSIRRGVWCLMRDRPHKMPDWKRWNRLRALQSSPISRDCIFLLKHRAKPCTGLAQEALRTACRPVKAIGR